MPAVPEVGRGAGAGAGPAAMGCMLLLRALAVPRFVLAGVFHSLQKPFPSVLLQGTIRT